ncbi:hypothetical protein DSO57_1012183 [Entomophthora muscae]|uniref:Uncharacterized protein n=1 Tax=Entomophthora muscae TaxID=34485 RepID=A0ACC2TGQ9_9FUNG|nr:hypothetical protein DSO57_1012183 [Entomophthora muscae]
MVKDPCLLDAAMSLTCDEGERGACHVSQRQPEHQDLELDRENSLPQPGGRKCLGLIRSMGAGLLQSAIIQLLDTNHENPSHPTVNVYLLEQSCWKIARYKCPSLTIRIRATHFHPRFHIP